MKPAVKLNWPQAACSFAGPICSPFRSEADSQRPLHHARRKDSRRPAKRLVGFNAVSIERQTGTDGLDVGMVEQVECFPTELESALLTQTYCLGEGKVGRDDPGKAQSISAGIAGVS